MQETVSKLFQICRKMTLDDLQANRKLMVEKVRKQRSDLQMMGGVPNAHMSMQQTPANPSQHLPPGALQQVSTPMPPVSVETNVARDPRRAAGMRHGMGTGPHVGQSSAPVGNFSKSINVPPPPPPQRPGSHSQTSTPPPPPPPTTSLENFPSQQSVRSLMEQQQAALQHANQISDCYFITQNSAYGNLIVPVIPRIEAPTLP